MLLNHTLTRLNTMGGPYQMFGHLADVVVINTMPTGEATFTYRHPHSMQNHIESSNYVTSSNGKSPWPISHPTA